MKEEVRIDKWLWATRIFKTRTIASDACKKGRVTIKGQNVKPSHGIRVGQVVEVRKPPVTYSFEVLGLIENRVGAKLVPNYLKNVTSRERYRSFGGELFRGLIIDRKKEEKDNNNGEFDPGSG